MSRSAFLLLAGAFALRVPEAFHYRFSTDEPQHLHVVWSWTQGLLPYRDVFDNHMPLFHLVFSPLAGAIGEDARMLYWMRQAMLPLAAVILGATARIGAALVSPRAGLVAAALTGLFPLFFLTSLEFRADVAWTAAWTAALVVLVERPPSPRRLLAAGILLGVAAAISIKTAMLLAALAAGGLAVLRLQGGGLRAAVRVLAPLTGGLLLPLGIVLASFAAAGAVEPFFYGTIVHNLVSHGRWREPLRLLELLVAGPLVSVVAWRALVPMGGARAAARVLAAVTAGVYVVILDSVWPVTRAQDWLPVLPLAGVLAGAMVERLGAIAQPGSWREALPLLAVGVAELCALVALAPPWADRTRANFAQITQALELTRPGESVMDTKGELVFRRRAPFWVLESITNERMRAGLLADDTPERMVAERAFVATLDSTELPPRTRSFLLEHYVQVGHLRVAGRILDPSGERSGSDIGFAIAVPGRYALVSPGRRAEGSLDGLVYDGPRELAAGPHVFRAAPGTGPAAIVWARAAERGFSPFAVLRP